MTGATSLSDFQLYDRNASYLLAESTQINERSQEGKSRLHRLGGLRSNLEALSVSTMARQTDIYHKTGSLE